MVKCNGLGNEVWGALQPPQHQRGARSLWHRKNHSVISNWITSQTYQKPQINLHTGRRDFWSIIASTCHVLETISHQIFQQRLRILEPFLQCHFFHAPHSFIFSLSFFFLQSRLWFICASPFGNDRKLFPCQSWGILFKLNSAGKVCWPWTLHSAMPTWLDRGESSSAPKKESKPAWGY